MPSQWQHIEQARENAQLLSQLLQDPEQYSNWVITIAFYAAVHLVEAFLANAAEPKHCMSHAERHEQVRRHLSEVGSAYRALYSASRRARYDCLRTTPAQCGLILQHYYEPVRARLCALLNVTL